MPDLRLTDPNMESTARETAESPRRHPTPATRSRASPRCTKIITTTTKAGSNGRA